MRSVVLGFVWGLGTGFVCSLISSIVICCGADPETRGASDAVSPLLAIFAGAHFASRRGSWIRGVWVGAIFVCWWVVFWLYVNGRWNPLLWIEEGPSHFTPSHLTWWSIAILTGALGGLIAQRRLLNTHLVTLVCFCLIAIVSFLADRMNPIAVPAQNPNSPFQIERQGQTSDGTTSYLMTFDFQRQPELRVGLYDCDSDDAKPYDNSNTSYMGQSLARLVKKLNRSEEKNQRRVFAVINGGFFGASGFSVGHHEEPMVLDGRALYDVDLLRPKDQGWFLALNSPPAGITTARPRFSMLPSIPWDDLPSYKYVLGGVRPLRVNGKSLPLQPGAGGTNLRCSRTSIGWSSDENKLYILVMHDPDGELASQFQRRMRWSQTGGWDAHEVQRFWEHKQVPNALLFDGGESTQLAFRNQGGYRYLSSGYQYSLTVGYLFERPLFLTPPILPPVEAHRGVLDYLYVDGPISQ